MARHGEPVSPRRSMRTALTVMALAIVGATSFVSARGQAATELEAAEHELDEQAQRLATFSRSSAKSECDEACRALASMRRAAEKICALSPGDRCEAAKAKADGAAARVREACPSCAIAAPSTAKPAPEPSKSKEDESGTKDLRATAQAAPAPPSEPRRGGCASCATTGSGTGSDLGVTILAFGLTSRLLRKRARQRRG